MDIEIKGPWNRRSCVARGPSHLPKTSVKVPTEFIGVRDGTLSCSAFHRRALEAGQVAGGTGTESQGPVAAPDRRQELIE